VVHGGSPRTGVHDGTVRALVGLREGLVLRERSVHARRICRSGLGQGRGRVEAGSRQGRGRARSRGQVVSSGLHISNSAVALQKHHSKTAHVDVRWVPGACSSSSSARRAVFLRCTEHHVWPHERKNSCLSASDDLGCSFSRASYETWLRVYSKLRSRAAPRVVICT
jgi:hypothetical protein